MKITKKYLIIPVSISAPKQSMQFFENDELVFDLFVHYQAENPDFLFYQCTNSIAERDITIKVDDSEITLSQTDTKDDSLCNEIPIRPHIHFTAKRGWINDPNGLCFDGEKYHMFFQHNPVGVLWGNMHWGHATSKDLLHWEENDDVLFPDKFGTMYSGSAVVDYKNVSGLGENGKPPLCLLYTSCGDSSNGGNSLLSKGMESLQHLAYSTDGGETFTKYANNPIIPEITKENRDPKVIFAEELQQYIMALYLEKNDYLLLTSKDLINWDAKQKLTIPGETECPDIYPLYADGKPEERLWIISGASDRYLVGTLHPDGKLFRAVQDVKEYQIGKCNYAAQTFFGINNRRIKTAWGMTPAPNCIFNNQMAVFTEVSLKKLGQEYFICTNPIAEYDTVAKKVFEEKIASKTQFDYPAGAYDITIEAMDDCEKLEIAIFGKRFAINCSDSFLIDDEKKIPLGYREHEHQIRIIADTLSVEMFLDAGLLHYAIPHIGTSGFTVEPLTGSCKVSIKKFDNLHIGKA